MKINTLHLIAYGSFTDTILDFAAAPSAFHMVYGPNEAGKSTALRALRNMLFGIPTRTPDSFRHPHPKLRIGAELMRKDREVLAFIRRKGLSKTLRAADDETLLDDNALAPFLGGVSRDLFEQMFAIDHQGLILGGEEIIAGGGRVGQALFATGAGLIQLQRFQRDLSQTMEGLFKPTGSKPRINRILSSLKTTRKRQKEAQLLAKTWEVHHQHLHDAQTRLEANRQQLGENQKAYNALERIREALPLIARRKEIHAALPAFENAPDLPEDFETKRREAENDLMMAANIVARSRKTLATIQAEMHALRVPKALLQHAPMVEALQQDLGSYKKAQQDRPVLETRRRTLRNQAAKKLAQTGIMDLSADNDSQQLTSTLIGSIQEMGKQHERLTTRLEALREQRRQLEVAIGTQTDRRASLAPPQDISALKATLQATQAKGPLEKQHAQACQTHRQHEKELSTRLQRQTLWAGALEELDALALPSREAIDRFEQQFNAAARQMERAQEDIIRKTEEQDKIETELRMIATTRDVPSEENLTAARDRRDAGWRLVRSALEGNETKSEDVKRFTATASLPDAFEASMHRADHIADRLRREAEQVSRKGLLEARKGQIEKASAELALARDNLRVQFKAVEGEWEKAWRPATIQPLSPAEMRAWLSDMVLLRDKAADLRLEKSQTTALASEIASAQSRLAASLTHAGHPVAETLPLNEMIRVAGLHVEAQETLRSQIEVIDRSLAQQRDDLKRVGGELDDLDHDMDRWKTAWAHHISRIGLGTDASPTTALAVIEGIREARAQQDEADVLTKRIGGIDRDAARFCERVEDLAKTLAPDLQERPVEEASVLLNARLTEARALESRRMDMQRALDAARQEKIQAETRQQTAEIRLKTLCHEAGCENPALLPEVEKQSRQRRKLMAECQDIEKRLRHLSAGATIDAFVAAAEKREPDNLKPEMAQLQDDIAHLESERSELDRTIGTEKAELKRMDGRAEAAGYAEEAEHLLARLETDVDHYARVKIASVLLARTIEQYREKHQGPLIKRASVLFSQMTKGAFNGVRTEYDEKGNPILVGIRSTGDDTVSVTGMSDGTADQLYLALRLASLEQYLDHSEPLPFVVDDILLRFDDDRAASTLKVLFELSAKTQIIFFTHHLHLLNLARTVLGEAKMGIHVLGDQMPPATQN